MMQGSDSFDNRKAEAAAALFLSRGSEKTFAETVKIFFIEGNAAVADA